MTNDIINYAFLTQYSQVHPVHIINKDNDPTSLARLWVFMSRLNMMRNQLLISREKLGERV